MLERCSASYGFCGELWLNAFRRGLWKKNNTWHRLESRLSMRFLLIDAEQFYPKNFASKYRIRDTQLYDLNGHD